jgi:hypothetical protein
MLVVHTGVTHTATLFGLGVIALAAMTGVGIVVNERAQSIRALLQGA